MGTITHTTSLPDSSEKTDFYSLVDNAQVSAIVNNDIASNAAIAGSKLATITTAGKVDGSAINNLANVPSGAGRLPSANLPTAIVNYVVPAGGIIMWSGTIASIPSGWVLCNGSNSTPDLRNRFIVAADADDSGAAKSTITGSALQTHDTGIMPAHTHSETYRDNSSGGSGQPAMTTASGATGSFDSDSTGTGTKVIAVFYALAFIMKT